MKAPISKKGMAFLNSPKGESIYNKAREKGATLHGKKVTIQGKEYTIVTSGSKYR